MSGNKKATKVAKAAKPVKPAAAAPVKTAAPAPAKPAATTPAKPAAKPTTKPAAAKPATKPATKPAAAPAPATTVTPVSAPAAAPVVKVADAPAKATASRPVVAKKSVAASGSSVSKVGFKRFQKKGRNTTLTPTEKSVIKALSEIESHSNELRADLHNLYLLAAREISLGKSGKRAVVLFVPYKLLTQFRRIQARLVHELEKKFSGKHVLIIAQRTILPKETRNNHVKRQKRPRSRTLTSVHDALLEDIVYPTEIVGKRTRYRLDSSRFTKVILDKKDQANLESKLDTFSAVYQRLTGKIAHFSFPVQAEAQSFAFTK